jgi:hypothetical protein
MAGSGGGGPRVFRCGGPRIHPLAKAGACIMDDIFLQGIKKAEKKMKAVFCCQERTQPS